MFYIGQNRAVQVQELPRLLLIQGLDHHRLGGASIGIRSGRKHIHRRRCAEREQNYCVLLQSHTLYGECGEMNDDLLIKLLLLTKFIFVYQSLIVIVFILVRMKQTKKKVKCYFIESSLSCV